mgnify:CR=1 FL=1
MFNRYKGIPFTNISHDCPRKGVYDVTEEDELQYGFQDIQYPDWLITDLRYPNELKRIKSVGGYTIRIERPLNLRFPDLYQEYSKYVESSQWESRDGFLTWISRKNLQIYYNIINDSEISLDEAEFDYTINNYGTIQDLLTSVSAIVKSIAIQEYETQKTRKYDS